MAIFKNKTLIGSLVAIICACASTFFSTSTATFAESNSNTITAVGADSATASITVNGSSHTSGNAATWQTGSNTVVATATKSGCTPTAYVITVTKEEE